MGLLRTVSPPPSPPAWRVQAFRHDWHATNFLGSLTEKQATAAKVTFVSRDGEAPVYEVFYPEA